MKDCVLWTRNFEIAASIAVRLWFPPYAGAAAYLAGAWLHIGMLVISRSPAPFGKDTQGGGSQFCGVQVLIRT